MRVLSALLVVSIVVLTLCLAADSYEIVESNNDNNNVNRANNKDNNIISASSTKGVSYRRRALKRRPAGSPNLALGALVTPKKLLKVRRKRKRISALNRPEAPKPMGPQLRPWNKPSMLTSATNMAQKTIVLPPQSDVGAYNRSKDDPRFLSLFTIVTFPNDVCTSGTGNNGTCYSSSDCSRLGGSASGSCASGFGVCCLFTATCGQSTNINCTFFQNSGFPSTFDSLGVCQLTVNKVDNNICQLRLDFENFVLAQPETVDHQCNEDQFIVSGGAPLPALCGTNTGQHVYVDVGLNSGAPCTLSAITGSSTFSRSFSIKISQIECTSLRRAPDGCLQYFTGLTGQITSFNYNNAQGLQLSGTEYAACVRMEQNFCSIQYTACTDTVNTPSQSFSITGPGDGTAGALQGTNCLTDYIIIPCARVPSTGTTADCVDRLCGDALSATNGGTDNAVTTFQKPFAVFVTTNAVETTTDADTNNRGFCLDYVQQPCTN